MLLLEVKEFQMWKINEKGIETKSFQKSVFHIPLPNLKAPFTQELFLIIRNLHLYHNSIVNLTPGFLQLLNASLKYQ
jgi:hypothetical protein